MAFGGGLGSRRPPPSRRIEHGRKRGKGGDSGRTNHDRKKHESGGDCVDMYDWQSKSFPTCNAIHERDLSGGDSSEGRLINHGNVRDVWSVEEFDGAKRVMKTMRIEHDMNYREYERERLDAISMERLTSSPHTPDIYGYCEFSI